MYERINNAKNPTTNPINNKINPLNPVLVPAEMLAITGNAKNNSIKASSIAKKNCFHFLFKQST